ncbi:13358_t:CDS:1 [Cetraspora pellucida]|uniref:13358_t:CDS:1 n=1 Tax=Cetraspora pellucida TaxID=1433469 RepID=A0A9N9NNN7_9GLOM|nr:13358_t:CDS:1 [Cetraspora pellucida]
MLPPSPEVHNSIDKLFQNAQRFANSQGYVLVKKRTRKDNRSKLKNMLIHCDRGGVYNNFSGFAEETHNRKTSTRLIDCSFELYATRRNGLWHLEIRNATHNYGLSNDMSGHPIVHRLTEEQKESVAIMTTSSSRSREIISTLRQNDLSMLVISNDIYNMHAQLRQQNLAGRTPIQALVDELQGGNFLYKYKCNNNGSVTHIFFTHKESVSLSHQYSTVILIDCTYKTNKFKMLLLNVIGITSFNKTFFSCFIFMKDEDKDDYKWALTNVMSIFDGMQKPGIIVTNRELALMNALKIIFPNSTNLLCA